MIFAISFALVSALVTSAADFNVTVGANNQPVFDPTSVTVQNGDTVHFEFVSKNHSVTQSTFANPCARADGGIDSGFLNVAGPNVQPVWSFKVNDASSPFWFYCAQKSPGNHCQAGMVFAVNPTADKSFDAFQAAAKSSADGTTGSTSAESSAGASPPADALAVGATTGTPSSSGSDTSVPSGSGFSTSNVAAMPSSSTSSAPDPNQSPNGSIYTGDSSSVGVATVVSLIVVFAAVIF